MIHKIKLDASKPQTITFEKVSVKLSKKQLTKLKTELNITNKVSNEILLQAYLNQRLK